MHKIFVTAIREFKSTALTPAFMIGTFVIPVVFYAVMIGMLASGALEGDKKAAQGVIGVVDRTEGDVITTQDIFLFDILGEDSQGRIRGQHRSTGIGQPKFWERARYYNEESRLGAALDRSNGEGSRAARKVP